MINATLLVPGCMRMKPHSLCSGLLVSAWKALNLWEPGSIKSSQVINLSQEMLSLLLSVQCIDSVVNTSKCDKKVVFNVICKPTWSWWPVGPHGWSLASLCSGKAWWWGNSPLQVHQTPRSPGASPEGEGLDSARLMGKKNQEQFYSKI